MLPPLDAVIRSLGGFARRRDLLPLGYTDGWLKAYMRELRIFRVRHGWYAVPSAPEPAIRAIRIGGRLTGVAALETYGLRVPYRDRVDVAVPANACRLRRPVDRRKRLQAGDDVRVHWVDPPRARLGSRSWRAPIDDALVVVLATEPRDIAIACCSAVMRYKKWSRQRMDAVFARAPQRAQRWRALVGSQDDSHGETFVRLWMHDEGIPWESQPVVRGLGRLDGRVSPNVYVEINGAQHDPNWTGGTPSTYEKDRDRSLTVTIDGGRVLEYTYRQIYADKERMIASIRRARDDDLELIARRKSQPRPPRGSPRSRRRDGGTRARRRGSGG